MDARNLVATYNSDTAITDTEATDVMGSDVAEWEFSLIRIKNDTGATINARFGNGNNVYVILPDENVCHPFKCTGKVALSVDSGSTTGNLFIQLTAG